MSSTHELTLIQTAASPQPHNTRRARLRLRFLMSPLGFLQHLLPSGVERLDTEIADCQPEEIFKPDVPGRQVRSVKFTPELPSTGAEMQMGKHHRATRLRMPVIRQDFLPIPIFKA